MSKVNQHFFYKIHISLNLTTIQFLVNFNDNSAYSSAKIGPVKHTITD